MAQKIQITNIASVGIIYRRQNPQEIFFEVKDDGYPMKAFRRKGCFIGGNWIGPTAENDQNTFATLLREIDEELTFDRSIRDSVELGLLGMADLEEFAPTPDPAAEVRTEDIQALNHLKEVVARTAIPFGDYLLTVPKATLAAADPTNTRDDFTALCSYYHIGLEEREWKMLVGLQERFKNLSNESTTLVTCLDEIIQTGTKTAFGHDRVLKDFFLGHKFEQAENLPLIPGIEVVRTEMPMDSYTDYLERYDVARHPLL